MKMAKASMADLDMAMDVANVLDDIERGFFPTKLQSDEDAESEQAEWIDTNDREQYGRLIFGLQRLLNKGSIIRVIWGMAVVCDPDNECIDPDADTIEHHPKRQQLEQQVTELTTDRDTWKSRYEFSIQERSKLEKRCENMVNKLDKHQKEAAIGRAVNRACEELPFGYDLHIELEKDAGTVRLYRPDGEEDDTEFHDCDYFSSAIENAINVAIAQAEKGGA